MDIPASQTQHDDDKNETAPNGAENIETGSRLSQIGSAGHHAFRDGILIREQVVDNIAQLAGFGKNRVEWQNKIAIRGLQHVERR